MVQVGLHNTQITGCAFEAPQNARRLSNVYANNFMRAGCKFSGVQTLHTLAIVEAKSGSRVWCGQKNTWHAEAAWRMEYA
jgi:hypothetical protein